ncbi:MAG TPA: hypothetical protein VMU04_16945 [Candidatus Acidoferrum sp.]|nr:hypothetical protein [Candidatus Acidoferrum sp.]
MTQAATVDGAQPLASGVGRPMFLLPAVQIWIWVSALATLAGWSLSAVGALNRVGYLAYGALVMGVFLVGRKAFGWQVPVGWFNWRRLRRRFGRWLPASFGALTLLVFLGGALYAPSNHAGFTYRTPRVLHWLMEGHWHWIHTANYRMNNRACGFEWMTAPLLLFTKSDRALFLLNFVAFLLMPGLIFSMFTRLGVRPRVAWYWMWLLPTGYNFLLQAGSTANDTFPAVYALAAMDFGLRAWASRRASDLWLCLLAAALLTGAKASNLPLLLPVGILVVPLLPLLRRRLAATSLVLLLAGAVSFLPTAALNVRYCGNWSGLVLEHAGMDMKNPFVGIWGNALLLLSNNFVPTFFPLAGWWNRSALSIMPQALRGPMVANFESGFHTLGEMPTEDWIGLGFGLSVLLGVSLLASGLRRSPPASKGCTGSRWLPRGVRWCVLVALWLSLLAYSMKSGMVTPARLISPYYPLLLPVLLLGAAQAEIVRRKWWRVMVWGVLVLALAVVVMVPGRPLWPAQTVLSKVLARKPGQPMVARALEVYRVYGNRWDSLANIRALFPRGLTVVGFMGHGDDIDISLWRPFFERRVENILLEDTPQQIRQRHIQYAVVSGGNLVSSGTSLAAWLERTGAELVATRTNTQTVALGPQPWYLVTWSEPVAQPGGMACPAGRSVVRSAHKSSYLSIPHRRVPTAAPVSLEIPENFVQRLKAERPQAEAQLQ